MNSKKENTKDEKYICPLNEMKEQYDNAKPEITDDDLMQPIKNKKITVQDVGVLLGMSDDAIRYGMKLHSEDPRQGLNIGWVKKNRSGRMTYYIDARLLADWMGWTVREVYKAKQITSTKKARAAKRSVPVQSFQFMTLCNHGAIMDEIQNGKIIQLFYKSGNRAEIIISPIRLFLLYRSKRGPISYDDFLELYGLL